MTIKELLAKLDTDTATAEDLTLLQDKQHKIFSSLSVVTIHKFQNSYDLVPKNKRSWEDFRKQQCKVLAECIRCEFLIPNDLREEHGLALISEDTVVEEI